MQIVSLTMGGPDILFNASQTVRLPFEFAAPAAEAYVLLQSLRFSLPKGSVWPFSYFNPSDVELDKVELYLRPLFTPSQSSTSGKIEVRMDLPASGFRGQVQAEVRMLVIGVPPADPS